MLPPSSTAVLAAVLISVGFANAAPTVSEQRDAGFSITQVRNPRFAGRHGALAVAKAYRKYGVPLPDYLLSALNLTALDKRVTGSAKTTPEPYDSEYLTPVSIGTPAQVLNLDFDTGSSDLWVFSSETPSNEQTGQTTYKPAKSSTSKKLSGATWSITYGDGSASSGDVYLDVVNVGGVSYASQAVENAKSVSSQFVQDTDNDGLLGLAFSSLNTVRPTQQKTFFDNVKSSLNSPLFTADLKKGKPGTYNFGFIDSSIPTSTITYTSVDTSQGFWSFTSSGYAVGSGTFTSTRTSGIADTGTTLLFLPSSVAKAYYKKVSGAKFDNNQGGYVFPCSATLPSFTYGIGSSRITIPGSYINFAPAGGSSCFGGLQDSSGIGINIYGDVALKAAFVVFSGTSSPQLGFASKKL